MKDMFLAEELGYDPYSDFIFDDNLLTKEDFLYFFRSLHLEYLKIRKKRKFKKK